MAPTLVVFKDQFLLLMGKWKSAFVGTQIRKFNFINIKVWTGYKIQKRERNFEFLSK